MFSWKVKLALGVYVFMILSIPVVAYVASQSQSKSTKTSASETNIPVIPPASDLTSESSPSATPKDLSSLLQQVQDLANPQATSAPDTTPTIATSFGPTLNLNLSLEGRPANKEASKVFVGIKDLNATQGQYILSFTIDLPDSGSYTGLSLAGLTVGNQYIAVIKPTVQLAKAVTFTMDPGVTSLNNGAAISFLTGDLNQDNVIDQKDLDIATSLFGTKPTSPNWNPAADFNLDGVINNYDVGYIYKNIGQTGDSGMWVSPIPQVASSSGSLNPASATASTTPSAGGPNDSNGYWMWVHN